MQSCDFCNREYAEESRVRCSTCKVSEYCSEDCMMNDKLAHAETCEDKRVGRRMFKDNFIGCEQVFAECVGRCLVEYDRTQGKVNSYVLVAALDQGVYTVRKQITKADPTLEAGIMKIEYAYTGDVDETKSKYYISMLIPIDTLRETINAENTESFEIEDWMLKFTS